MTGKRSDVVCVVALPGDQDIRYGEYCLKTWKWWCERNGVLLHVLDTPLPGGERLRPNWQRYLVFEALAREKIAYDQVAVVDLDTMVRWDCPNFFRLTRRRFTAVPDLGNFGWIHHSLNAYQALFPGIHVERDEYFNAGFVVVNAQHRRLYDAMIEFYDSTHAPRLSAEAAVRGPRHFTDQTPLNYLVRKRRQALTLLPIRFNFISMASRQCLVDSSFIELAYIWHFTGFQRELRHEFKRTTWNAVRPMYGAQPRS